MPAMITVYWVSFGLGMVYLIISFILSGSGDAGDAPSTDAGLDLEADLDADVDLDADAGLEMDGELEADESPGHVDSGGGMLTWNVLSPVSIAGFLTAFGGSGLLASGYGMHALPALVVAVIGGLIIAVILWLVVGKLLFGLQSSSLGAQSSIIGQVAEVITPLSDTATGEIAYVLRGSRYTAPARSMVAGEVARYSKVRIRRIKDQVILVQPLRKLLD